MTPGLPDVGAELAGYRLESLISRGDMATVRVRARGAGDVIAERIEIADCSQDPPYYPVDCEVAL